MRRSGFTLVEILLSIALIGIITGIGAVVYQQLQGRNDLDLAATAVAQSMRRAQVLSRAMDGDTSWGVRVNTGSVILFQGTAYAARVIAYDETTAISPALIGAGFTEVVFAKLTGLPLSTGTLTLTGPNGVRTLTLNAQGTITY